MTIQQWLHKRGPATALSIFVAGMTIFSGIAYGELTIDQKLADFRYMAAVYAKNYAPYQWKRDLFGFDLFAIDSWLERVKASRDDLEFYDICVRYVASLRDSHAKFTMFSDFMAYLPFGVDIYDGKVLINARYGSPADRERYGLRIGDELISVDGKPVAELIESFLPYVPGGGGNESARRRLAADVITIRQQGIMPRAPEAQGTSTVVIRDPNGVLSTNELPWLHLGTALWDAGVVSTPRSINTSQTDLLQRRLSRNRQMAGIEEREASNRWGVWTGEFSAPQIRPAPAYLDSLRSLQASEPLGTPGFAGFGVRNPVFDPPDGFERRVGGLPTDEFLSGTFPLGEHRIGFIRIPQMGGLNAEAAPAGFGQEIAYLQANTDALVIDLMRNGGGSNCFAEDIARYLLTKPFRGVASRLRASHAWIYYYSRDLYSSIANNAPQSVIDLYSGFVAELQDAMKREQGLTRPVPICTPNFENVEPARDSSGNLLAYTKPILALVDEFTGSAAEDIPMFLQDEGRGKVLGVRTNGAGGAPGQVLGGAYSGGLVQVTQSLVTRRKPVRSPGFPETDLIENAGVYPDIVVNYMTRDNLMNGGQDFLRVFTQAIAEMIAKQ